MKLNPKKDLIKKRTRKSEEDVKEDVQEKPKPSIPKLNQDEAEKQNLRKLQKSLRDLIAEKEGGGKLKTFSLT